MKINFCAGPAVVPTSIIQQLQQMMTNYKDTGVSLLSISHRDKVFDEVHASIQKNLRSLLSIPDNYAVLLMQAGATAQFAAIPLNLADKHNKALYVCSGQWSEKAAQEAAKFIDVDAVKYDDNIAQKFQANKYDYIYYTDNETVDGFQINKLAKSCNTELVCDVSSSFLSKPINISDYGLIYAGAQKNAGIPGLTIVIIKDSLIKEKQNIPVVFDYLAMKKSNSVYNTPSVISWVTFELTLEYLIEKFANLDNVEEFSNQKANLLYLAIDNSKIYKNDIKPEYRSNMNIIFHLPTQELTDKFLSNASKAGFYGLKGHRSVGGCKASLYNAVSLEDVKKLVQFMQEFENEQF
ncbi:3-phosphoserine/phosphohydroxythreonine transaminase [Francisella tularensis]|uniref:Phosphoserine aminotransferase n=2 Tax=Francisella tularensis subsp. holarctica TaxID=119857 RepID=A0AAI8BHX8_FRATH|nr:3-phosphoserine/phosphohydroxythreonine transaminase [Francisella tularensis]EBA52599.1 phosphoserine aminotransferase [Francisella tularensis subsp. holarctica 257]AJI59126.1 aminotransferase class-V family protein [Francisella tularensis subsp. holarctica LVS]AYF36678.1 3-phosphoserine/phosphohydroxythreonine transaminase [Francisella tularensis subsp. holarctica]KXO30102.1 MFS transporter [Francisella tularensis]KXO31234.1 MFS transporter [Francisella tularensis]